MSSMMIAREEDGQSTVEHPDRFSLIQNGFEG